MSTFTLFFVALTLLMKLLVVVVHYLRFPMIPRYFRFEMAGWAFIDAVLMAGALAFTLADNSSALLVSLVASGIFGFFILPGLVERVLLDYAVSHPKEFEEAFQNFEEKKRRGD